MNLIARFVPRLRTERLVVAACSLSLLGMGLVVLSVLMPKPIPVILAMSLGQAIGVAALLAYGIAVLIHASRERLRSKPPSSRRSEER